MSKSSFGFKYNGKWKPSAIPITQPISRRPTIGPEQPNTNIKIGLKLLFPHKIVDFDNYMLIKV